MKKIGHLLVNYYTPYIFNATRNTMSSVFV